MTLINGRPASPSDYALARTAISTLQQASGKQCASFVSTYAAFDLVRTLHHLELPASTSGWCDVCEGIVEFGDVVESRNGQRWAALAVGDDIAAFIDGDSARHVWRLPDVLCDLLVLEPPPTQ